MNHSKGAELFPVSFAYTALSGAPSCDLIRTGYPRISLPSLSPGRIVTLDVSAAKIMPQAPANDFLAELVKRAA